MNLKSDRFLNTIRIPIQNKMELVKIYRVTKVGGGLLGMAWKLRLVSHRFKINATNAF